MPAWLQVGFSEYQQRLPREWRLQLVEISAAKRAKNGSPEQWLKQEAERILAKLPANADAIALDGRGRQWTTEQLASQLAAWQQNGRQLAFIIGGADGLADSVLHRCRWRWSLSALTFPHMLVRLIIAEQLYRAWSILMHHPYHRS